MNNYGPQQGGGDGIAAEIHRLGNEMIQSMQMGGQLSPHDAQYLRNALPQVAPAMAQQLRGSSPNPGGGVYVHQIKSAVQQFITNQLTHMHQGAQQQQLNPMMGAPGGNSPMMSPPPPPMMGGNWSQTQAPQSLEPTPMAKMFQSSNQQKEEEPPAAMEQEDQQEEQTIMYEQPELKEYKPIEKTRFNVQARHFKNEASKRKSDYYTVELDWPVPVADLEEVAIQAKNVIDSSDTLGRRNTLVAVRVRKIHMVTNSCQFKEVEKGLRELRGALEKSDEKTDGELIDALKQFHNSHLITLGNILLAMIEEYMAPIMEMGLLFADPAAYTEVKTIEVLEDLFYPREKLNGIEEKQIPDDYGKRVHSMFRGLINHIKSVEFMNPSDPRTQIYLMSAATRKFGIPVLEVVDGLARSLSPKVDPVERRSLLQDNAKTCQESNTCAFTSVMRVMVACRDDVCLMSKLDMLDIRGLFQPTLASTSDVTAISLPADYTPLLAQIARSISKPLYGYPLYIIKDNYRVGMYIAKGYDDYDEMSLLRM